MALSDKMPQIAKLSLMQNLLPFFLCKIHEFKTELRVKLSLVFLCEVSRIVRSIVFYERLKHTFANRLNKFKKSPINTT